MSFILVFILVLSIVHITIPVHAATSVHGTVYDEFDIPIDNAQVSVWLGRSLVTATQTDNDGNFNLDVDLDPRYSILVFADLDETPGIDYFPVIDNLTSINGNYAVGLKSAASIIVSGDLQFVEIEDIPNNIVYTVYDSDGQVIELNGFTLVYNSNALIANLLGLDSKHLIVPLDQNLSIGIQSRISVSPSSKEKNINITDPNFSSLIQGDSYNLDIKPHYISYNMEF